MVDPRPKRPDRRSDARERALYLLYESNAKGISPVDALELQIVEPMNRQVEVCRLGEPLDERLVEEAAHEQRSVDRAMSIARQDRA